MRMLKTTLVIFFLGVHFVHGSYPQDDIKKQLAELRAELRAEADMREDSLRAELRAEFAATKAELQEAMHGM